MSLSGLWYIVSIIAHFVTPAFAMSTVALLGYAFGRRTRNLQYATVEKARQELKRARTVVRDLERVSALIRSNIERHEASLARFKTRLAELTESDHEGGWQDLCHEAEELLRPTMRLANKLTEAYDDLRQQSNKLMAFTDVRTDPLTGLNNRRALDETLAGQIALRARYGFSFSLAILDVDHFKQVNDNYGHLAGDGMLQQVSKLLESSVRETDFVARYGGEEFVILMAQTELDGACLLAERLRAKVAEETRVTLSGGVAAAREFESAGELLARADTALYQAKAAGRNQVYSHNGETMTLYVPPPQPVEAT